MGLRVLMCVAFCVVCVPRAAAQAGGTAPANQADSQDPAIPPLSAQGETLQLPAATPSAPVAEASAAGSGAAPGPVDAQPAPAVAPPTAAANATPPARKSAATLPAGKLEPQRHDLERAPPEVTYDMHLTMRLSLGIEAAMLGVAGEYSLMRPTFASFDIGYSPLLHWAFGLRAASWLSFGSFVSEFAGVTTTYSFLQNMFVTGALGLAFGVGTNPNFSERLQGVAAQLDLGQRWPFSQVFDIAVGAHFELATPWLGPNSLADFGVGLFVSAGYR